MRTAVHLALATAAPTLVFFFQEEQLLTIGGVTPNLIAVFLIITTFRAAPAWFSVCLSAALIVTAFLWTPFWIVPVMVLVIVVFSLRFLRRLLTGNRTVDVIGAFFFVPLVAAALTAALSRAPFPLVPIAGEAVMTALFGTATWLVVCRVADR
ncbi:MAG: hypothetical protein AAB601_02380 [Patescibacteria group bacterium]